MLYQQEPEGNLLVHSEAWSPQADGMSPLPSHHCGPCRKKMWGIRHGFVKLSLRWITHRLCSQFMVKVKAKAKAKSLYVPRRAKTEIFHCTGPRSSPSVLYKVDVYTATRVVSKWLEISHPYIQEEGDLGTQLTILHDFPPSDGHRSNTTSNWVAPCPGGRPLSPNSADSFYKNWRWAKLCTALCYRTYFINLSANRVQICPPRDFLLLGHCSQVKWHLIFSRLWSLCCECSH
jgi:hypothetical protein